MSVIALLEADVLDPQLELAELTEAARGDGAIVSFIGLARPESKRGDGVDAVVLEHHPTLVRGLLVGLTHRLVELTNRLAELTGGRIEARLARFFLKLATDIGQARADGIFIALVLSRQELADMIGTTIETSIRIMSRWGKEDIVRTEKDGFVVANRKTLEALSLT